MNSNNALFTGMSTAAHGSKKDYGDATLGPLTVPVVPVLTRQDLQVTFGYRACSILFGFARPSTAYGFKPTPDAHDPFKASNTLFFGGLSQSQIDVTALTVICEVFGRVLDVSFQPERHQAFIHFAVIDQARQALICLQGFDLFGARIRVNWASNRRQFVLPPIVAPFPPERMVSTTTAAFTQGPVVAPPPGSVQGSMPYCLPHKAVVIAPDTTKTAFVPTVPTNPLPGRPFAAKKVFARSQKRGNIWQPDDLPALYAAQTTKLQESKNMLSLDKVAVRPAFSGWISSGPQFAGSLFFACC